MSDKDTSLTSAADCSDPFTLKVIEIMSVMTPAL